MRFLDHACKPAAHFHQLCNGEHHTIVAATCRDVEAGEVITVFYGDDLWFDCDCEVCGKRKKKE